MNAHTTITAAPAKARQKPTALKTFAQAHEALRAAQAAYDVTDQARAAAETALFAARNTRPLVPAPGALHLRSPTETMTLGGKEITLPETAFVFTSAEEILTHFGGDEAKAEPFLTALAEHEARQADLDRESGFAAVVAALKQAEDSDLAAVDALTRAQNDLYRCPTLDAREIRIKRATVLREDRYAAKTPAMMIVDATLSAMEAPAAMSSSRAAWDQAVAALAVAEAEDQRLEGAYAAAPGDAELAEQYDEHLDVLAAARLHVLHQTPTDLAGLLTQMRISLEQTHCGGREYPDDELTISRLLTPQGDWAMRDAALLYRSALRLAGQSSPALDAKPFDASAWIDDLRDIPDLSADVILDKLSALPAWQKELVQEEDMRRQGEAAAQAALDAGITALAAE